MVPSHRFETRTRGLVPRAKLFERLSAGGDAGVTLLSAPAGSGKTVLLRSWLDHDAPPHVAWVSIDPDERDAQHFWLQVVDALRSTPAADAIAVATPTPDFDGPAFVDYLLRGLDALDDRLVLVIDDVHELRSPDAVAQLERFIQRRPRHLRLVLSSRRDPALGLHRLRLTGELTELRAADLRFTPEETAELLSASGIVVSEAVSARLHARTEGWAAALGLAAWSLEGRANPERFLDDFSGSDRTVADYLLAEVLDRQPDDIRRLLVRTSILDRVSGALADRLLEANGSDRLLLELESSNAFVTALDAERTWFRYHQLFVDLLRLELRRTAPEDILSLHRSAAAWHLEHGHVLEALRHDVAAEDWGSVTAILSDHGLSLVLDGHGPQVDEALGAYPLGEQRDPELLALRAYRDLSARSLERAVEDLSLAERAASEVPPGKRRRTEVALGLTRLTLARRLGDVDRALAEVAPLLEPVTAADPRDLVLGGDARAVALVNLGIAELWASRLPDAERHLEQALVLARDLARPYVEIAALAHLSLVVSTRRFAPARELADAALALADRHGWSTDIAAAVAAASIAAMDAAQGRFTEARRSLERARPRFQPENEHAAGALLTRFIGGDILAGVRRFPEALEQFRAADALQEVLATRHALTGPVRASAALVELLAGDVDAARATVRTFREDERDQAEARVATAAVQLRDGRPREALETLRPVLAGDVPVLRTGTSVEALVLAASATDATEPGATAGAAGDLIERALDAAEPDGLILHFLLVPARPLLERHPRHGTAHAALLADVLDAMAGSLPSGVRASAPTDELSSSEMRVLRYLPSNLTASEIAAELFVSTSTVKTHMRHVYDKLGAHRRTEAVERARSLGLLAPSARRT